MTVSVVVEDGTVVEDANSYIDVAFAEAYLEANIHVFPTWEDLDDDSKAALVVWATRYLDQRAAWKGYKTTETSALRWPRTGVYNRDGILIDPNEIPEQLKQATAEMARYLISSDRSIERGTDGLTRLKVDVIELEFDKNYRFPEVPNEINILLAGLGTINGGNFPRFMKIVKA
jgi:hypothetical protein